MLELKLIIDKPCPAMINSFASRNAGTVDFRMVVQNDKWQMAWRSGKWHDVLHLGNRHAAIYGSGLHCIYVDDAILYIVEQSMCHYVTSFAICNLDSHSEIDCKGWGSPGCSHTAALPTTAPLVKAKLEWSFKVQVLDYVRMCGTVVSFDSNSHIYPSMDPSALYTCVGGIYVVVALQ